MVRVSRETCISAQRTGLRNRTLTFDSEGRKLLFIEYEEVCYYLEISRMEINLTRSAQATENQLIELEID